MNALHQRTRRRLLSAVILVMLLILLSATAAAAHPLGNFTTNRYSKIDLSAEALSILYVVDMAEIPAFKAISAIDADKDGETAQAERNRYLNAEISTLVSKLHLTVNGEPLPLQTVESKVSFPPGQAGLQTLRLEVTFLASLPDQDRFDLHFRDDNGVGALGWREIVVQAARGVAILDSSAPSSDLSQALTVYPVDLLQNPPAVREATVRFRPAAVGQSGHLQPATTAPAASGATDPFADLIALPVDGPMALFLALLAAFVWGAAHAMSPGHGKTIVAAYLVGSRGTAKHALFLGLTTTITHTMGVFLLGAVTLFAAQFILPEQILPWLSVGSGLLVISIGVSLFWGRLRPILARQAHHHFHESYSRKGDPSHDHSHEHSHEHSHGHHHGLVHSHDGHTHSHVPPGADGESVTWSSLLALGVFGGLLPCPSALVVMLGAIALGRIGFGLFLILVFSLGLASVLTLVGILMVHAGKLFRYVPEGGRILRLAPIGSALFITMAGVAITVQALLSIGSLSL